MTTALGDWFRGLPQREGAFEARYVECRGQAWQREVERVHFDVVRVDGYLRYVNPRTGEVLDLSRTAEGFWQARERAPGP